VSDAQIEHYKILAFAVRFAANAHRNQDRKGGGPYILHPIRVSKMVSYHGGSDDATVAAVLHDVIEDTPYDFALIQDLFGARVGHLIGCLTNSREMEEMSSAERKEAQAIKYAGAEAEVQLIKLADQTDNLESLREAITRRNHKWVARYAQGALSVASACRPASETLYGRAKAAYEAVGQALIGAAAPGIDVS